MKLFWVFLAISVAPVSCLADVHKTRRDELRKALPEGITVLFGNTEKEAGDSTTGFIQEPNFYYLTGWREPGAILVLSPAADAQPNEILFIPRRSPEQEKWTGPKADPEDSAVARSTGFETVMPAERMETELRRLLERYPKLYKLQDHPASARLAALAPLREISNAANQIAKLRMKKSPEEIALIQRSTDLTMEAHRAAWRRAAAGMYEYQIATTMGAVYFEEGCERHAYSPIVGSGPNAVTLHYSKNSRRMDKGELLLMDVGAECAGYASDITRTVPVGGKFTERQREIYEIVLGAQKAAIAAVKPGMTIGKTTPNSIYKVAYDYIDSHGKDKHGNPLGKYFTHGVGHHVGLEVHDAYDPTLPLEEGMVITVEPGIYIPDENIGVRIEDMVLVTKNGAKILSAALPTDPDEIERALAKPRQK
ncbi:MAG: Xaa-Pro peptidase family protein [Bryobacteraceae bacterium]